MEPQETPPNIGAADQGQPNIEIQLLNPTALYAGTVILNRRGEEVILEFSSGPVSSGGGKGVSLPIHTRIAMTSSGATGLYELIGDKLDLSEPAWSAAPEEPQPE